MSIKYIIKKILYLFLWIIYRMLWIFPIDEKKVVISDMYGRQLTYQGKDIIEYIYKYRKDIKIVLLINKKKCKYDFVKKINPKSIFMLYELATAKVWVDDCRKSAYLRKRKNQFYIMIWHGESVPIKTIEKDAIKYLPKYYIDNAKNDSKMADLLVAGNEFQYNIMRNSFWYDGEILKAEFKNYFDNETIDKVKKFYNLTNQKIILYAPTFRNKKTVDVYDLKLKNIISELKKENYVIIYRLHPNMLKLTNEIVYDDKILNGTIYKNVKELIYAADLILTDFSSILTMAYRQNKKTILYMSDLNEYIKNDRSLYFTIDDLPSPLIENQKDLINCINNYNWNKYDVNIYEFNKKMNYYDLDAVEEICERIFEKIK